MSQSSSKVVGSGGLSVSKDMRDILAQSGYISVARGGQKLRELYCAKSFEFDSNLLRPFALWCYRGRFEEVKNAIESGTAPDLTGTETPFQFGYATLVIAGAQRHQVIVGPPARHVDVLRYILARGAPPDVPDIVGYTALYHATMKEDAHLATARVLLENGANVNFRNRYGETPLHGPLQTNQAGSVDMLLEFGADMDVAEADGWTTRRLFLQCGPQVTAVVAKRLRERKGEAAAPLVEKKCDSCGKSEIKLKFCSRCQMARYCSSECQRADWKARHKRICQPFSASNTVTLKPFYDERMGLVPSADFIRNMIGINTAPMLERNKRTAHAPKNLSEPKNIIVKVQVPYFTPREISTMGARMYEQSLTLGDLLVYTKKRDFACMIREEDNRAGGGYTRVSEAVRAHGVGGAKAYFAAELRSKDELVVKVSEVLAEQPF